MGVPTTTVWSWRDEGEAVVMRVARQARRPPTALGDAPRTRSLLHYLRTVMLAPRRGLERLMADPRRLRLALVLITTKAAVYTVIIFLLHLGEMPIMIPAWLALPAEGYYFWETFFIGAVTFASWFLAAGVVQVSSHACGGTGRYEDVLATTAFAIALPSLATIIPDLTVGVATSLGRLDPLEWARMSVTPGPWRTLIWGYLGLYLTLLVVLFPLAVAAAHGVRGWRAIWLGLLGAVVYQGTYFIFIR